MKAVLWFAVLVMTWSCSPYEDGSEGGSDERAVIGHRGGVVVRAGDFAGSIGDLALPLLGEPAQTVPGASQKPGDSRDATVVDPAACAPAVPARARDRSPGARASEVEE